MMCQGHHLPVPCCLHRQGLFACLASSCELKSFNRETGDLASHFTASARWEHPHVKEERTSQDTTGAAREIQHIPHGIPIRAECCR